MLKSRKTVRVLTTVVVLMMIFQLAVGASAAVSWTEGNRSYTASVSNKTSAQKWVAVPNTSVYHIQGTSTPLSCVGTKTVTATYSGQTNPTYPGYVLQALAEAGLRTTNLSESYTYNNTLYIPSTYASGNYCVGVMCNGYTATWTISYFDVTRAVNVYDTGNVYFAPAYFPSINTPQVITQ